jgi:hypothetical protein
MKGIPMIKIQYKKFMTFPFSNALQALTSHKYDPRVSYALGKITDKCMSIRRQLQEEYKAIIDKYATKDASGKIVNTDPNDPRSFDIEESKMAEYKTVEAEWGEKYVEIDRDAIPYSKLGAVQFTPNEAFMLSEVVNFEDQPQVEPVGDNVTSISSSK